MPEVSNLSIVIPVLVCAISGMLIYLVHGFFLNRYLLMQNNLIIAIILPTVALVITRAISSNFFLSLGMIGALSIVRFRNPVKNPFELIIFFALITIGIGVAVDVKLGVGLTVVLMILIIVVKILNDFYEKRGKKIFSLSFEEGNINHEINVKSKNKINILEDHVNLSQFFLTKNPTQYNYNLIYSDKAELNKLKKKLEVLEDIEDIDIRYGN